MGKISTDLIGKRFGKWVVVSKSQKTVCGNTYWDCICDCGNKRTVARYNLITGASSNCGCIRKEKLRTFKYATTHGCRNTPEYRLWRSMISRCYNKKVKNYADYGGRGIIVCDRWLSSFENFLSDVGLRPSRNHSIDRWPDNNGIYEPSNFRWATKKEQARNRRSNFIIEINGDKKCISEWADIGGIKNDVLRDRVLSGWDINRTILDPNYNRNIINRGQFQYRKNGAPK